MSARPSVVRRAAVSVLVALAWIALAVAPVAVWAQAQVLETDRWVAVAAPLSREPVVRAALADWATDELVRVIRPAELLRRALPDRADPLSVPLAGAVTRFVHDRVAEYLRTDEFSELWATAVARVHRAALRVLEGDAPGITAGAEGITIDLRPLLQRVLDRLTAATPELFGRTLTLPDIDVGRSAPDDLGLVTVYDHGRLRTAQDGLHQMGRLVGLIVGLAVVLPVAAIALSPRRGRTIALLLGGALVGAVIVRRALDLLGDEVLVRIDDADGRAVADRLIGRLVEPLTAALGTIVAVTAVALVVGVLARHRPDVARLVRQNRPAIQVGLATAGLAALLLMDLAWLPSALVIVAVGTGVWLLSRLRPEPPRPPPAPG